MADVHIGANIKDFLAGTGKVKVSLEEVGQKAKKATGDFVEGQKKVNKTAGEGSETFNKLRNVIIAAFGVGQLKAFIGESMAAYKEAENALLKLRAAYGDNVTGFNKMVAMASELQDKLLIPDDVFMSNVAFLKQAGRTDEQIVKMIKTAQGIKSALGLDLQTTIIQLNKTFKQTGEEFNKTGEAVDGSEGRLSALMETGIKFTKEQLAQGAAIDQLSKQYEKFAEAVANAPTAELERAELQWGDYKESVGKTVYELLNVIGVMPKVSEALKGINDIVNNESIPAWARFNAVLFQTGEAQLIEQSLKVKEAQMKQYLLISEKGNKQQKIDALEYIGELINADSEYLRIYEELLRKKKEATTKAAETAVVIKKEKTEAEIEAEKKAAEEFLKLTKDALRLLKQLRIDNTRDVVEQLRKKQIAELEALKETYGATKYYEELKKEVILRYQQEIEAAIHNRNKTQVDIFKKQAAEREKAEADSLTKILKNAADAAEGADPTANWKKKEGQMDLKIANMLGIDVESLALIKESLNEITNNVQAAFESWVQIQEQKAAYYDKQISENLQRIQIEQKAQEMGYNNDVDGLKKRDADLQKQRDKANKELQKAKIIQVATNSAMEASNITLAISKIFRDTGIAVPLAIALTALMVGSFLTSKAMAIKAAQQTQYGEGGSLLLKGKRHPQGGIDVMPGVNAEDGEMLGIFSRRATAANSGLPALIDAINKGQIIVDKDNLLKGMNNNIYVKVEGQRELTDIRDLLYEDKINKSYNNVVKYGSTTTIYRN